MGQATASSLQAPAVMPAAIRSVCSYPGCGRATTGSRCPQHAEQTKREREARRRKADASRPSSGERGYGSKWRKERDEYLKANPWCAVHAARGVREPATVVDHIKPPKGDDRLFWRRSNWQPLCRRCHGRKTAREDGAFGNPVRRDSGEPSGHKPGGRGVGFLQGRP